MKTSHFKRRIDSILSGSFWRQIGLLFIANILVFGIALISWELYNCYKFDDSCPASESNESGNFIWKVYNHYIDTGNQADIKGKERIFAFFTSFIGSIFFGCLLISTLSNIIERRVEKCRNGMVRYKMSDHYVIIGADAMLPGLIHQLLSKASRCQIVIQTTKDVEETRRKLFSQIPHKYEKRIYICYARRDSKEELEAMHVAEARELYILGDSGELDDVEYYHDSMNVDCLYLTGIICKEHQRPEPLPCYMLMEYRSTFNVFQFSDIPEKLKESIELHPFNFYETWARKVLVLNKASRALPDNGIYTNSEICYKSLDYKHIDYNSDYFVHLVIIGMSRMGEALAIETAHIAHYPNFIRDRKKKTRITFIDSNAREEMDKFKQSFPHLFNVSYSRFIDTENGTETISTPLDTYAPLGKDLIDTEWQFVQGRAESDTVKNLLCKWADDPDALMTVAVCLNLTHTSIATAMYLPDNIFTKEIPVLVQQRITSAIIDNISGEAGTQKKYYKYRNLRPFGMLCECLTLDNTLLEQAKRVNHIYNLTYSHNENRIEPNANLEAHMTDNITDNYRKGWEELKRNKPVVKQWSNIYNACSIPTKLRSAGICPNELKNLTVLDDDKVRIIAEVEHNRWNIEELMLGYRPFNFNENAEFQNLSETAQNEMVKDKKNIYIHYDIREYSQLPEVTKIYDITASRYIPFIVNGTTAYDQNNQII
jgi:hypothetical protein